MRRALSIVVILALLPPVGPRTASAQPPIPGLVKTALLEVGFTEAGAVMEWRYIYGILTFQTGWTGNFAQGIRTLIQNSTVAESVASEGVIHEAIVGVIEACAAASRAADLPVQQFLRDPSRWARMGPRAGAVNVRLLFLLAMMTVAAAATGIPSYLASREYHLKERAIFEADAAEDMAFLNSLGLLYEGMLAGRVELQPGLELEDAIRRIRENMERNRPPFIDVLEPRPCPRVAGPWGGELVVKNIRGDTNIQVGESRTFNGSQFVISQGDNPCLIRLKLGRSEISGYLARSVRQVAHQIGDTRESEELDVFILDEDATGSLQRAELTLYGPGSGLLQGQLRVEVEQRGKRGALIVSGGILEGGEHPPVDEPSRFEITGVDYPGSVQSGGARGDLSVGWSGNPEFPVTLIYRLKRSSRCPGSICEAVDEEFKSRANPLVARGTIWCMGFREAVVFDYEVLLRDETGQETAAVSAAIDCVP